MTRGLNYNLIYSAVLGNESAIKRIVKIYEPYINTLSSKKLYDEHGNEYIGVDVDMQECLKSKLIDIIIKYKLA